MCSQSSYGPTTTSFAELLTAPYGEDVAAALAEDLDPFQDVALDPAPPLPSFQETYGFKMDDECYNVATPAPAQYHHHHPHHHSPHTRTPHTQVGLGYCVLL